MSPLNWPVSGYKEYLFPAGNIIYFFAGGRSPCKAISLPRLCTSCNTVEIYRLQWDIAAKTQESRAAGQAPNYQGGNKIRTTGSYLILAASMSRRKWWPRPVWGPVLHVPHHIRPLVSQIAYAAQRHAKESPRLFPMPY
jgi:hypothetical protein